MKNLCPLCGKEGEHKPYTIQDQLGAIAAMKAAGMDVDAEPEPVEVILHICRNHDRPHRWVEKLESTPA